MQLANLNKLPIGQLVTRQWLLAQGISVHKLDNWVKSGKLISLARGVFAREGSVITWKNLASSLNVMSDTPVYVGALTALELSGYGQYITEKLKVTFCGEGKEPPWLSRVQLDNRVRWRNSRKLWDTEILTSSGALQEVEWQPGLPPYWVARPELAFMELLEQVPKKLSFEHADELMLGLSSLSPKRLDILLKGCNSIKVKRLFLYFARESGFAWYKKLNLEHYDLGSGKREIQEGGKLDKEFLITVSKKNY